MQDLPIEECYRLLELEPGASAADVRDAYRTMCRVWHPDRFPNDPAMQARAGQRQLALNQAHRQLLAHLAEEAARSSAEQRTAQAAGARAAGPHALPADMAAPGSAGASGWRGRLRVSRTTTMLLAATLCAIVASTAAMAVVGGAGVMRTTDGRAVHATAAAAGGEHACAADNIVVACWGAGLPGLPAEPGGPPGSFVASVTLPAPAALLAGGLHHACALAADGSAWCWGGNFAGQLGTGGIQDREEPGRVALPGPVAALASLGRHSCAVDGGGVLYCWGDDTDGQLGIGNPVAACAIGSISLHCSDRPERVAGGPWSAVAAGGSHSCGIVEGALHCWGSNRHGQLGGDATERCTGPGGAAPCRRRPAPVAVPAGPVTAVVAGASHTCALVADGRAFCWGLNAMGQAGTGGGDVVSEPTEVATGLRFHSLAAGAYHTCGVTERGVVHCWGSDASRELRGKGRDRCADGRCALQPVRLAGGASAATAGFGVTCAHGNDGRLRCWGLTPRRSLGGGGRDAVGATLTHARSAWIVLKRNAYRLVLQPLSDLR